MTQRHPIATQVLLLGSLCAVGALVHRLLPVESAPYLAPALTSIAAFLAFTLLLHWRIGDGLFGEIGFLYMGIISAYTVMPAAAFMATGLDEAGPLAGLLPDASELVKHLWRLVMFQCGVGASYILFRGKKTATAVQLGLDTRDDSRALIAIVMSLAISLSTIVLMSAPVETYYEHYHRFDHLSWLPRKFVSASLRASMGLYGIAFVFLFRDYKRYRFAIPILALALVAFEMTYSFGARIQALIIILQVIVLYHYCVRPISIKWGAIACLAVLAVFSAAELLRTLNFDLESATSAVSSEGLRPASEFGAVFFTSFHLYAERTAGTLPTPEWPMFFSDIISAFTFGDFSRWNPMEWYHQQYYPEVDIAPFTLGPVADSAIWGGEVDLVLRSLVNGAFFAMLTRWLFRRRHEWWALASYAYCYATCILTLKYGVFYHLIPMVKTVIPVLVIVHAVRVLRWRRSQSEGWTIL